MLEVTKWIMQGNGSWDTAKKWLNKNEIVSIEESNNFRDPGKYTIKMTNGECFVADIQYWEK